MDWLTASVIQVISYLMPGFLMAWVFYGLTAHPKREPFDRIVQALIFTVIIHGVVAVIRGMFWPIGLSDWPEQLSLVCSVIVAALLGVLFAGLANNNTLHYWLFDRRFNLTKRLADEPRTGWRWTTRTAYPSEWYSAFQQMSGRYVTLHLKGGRRLYGWPEEWPDQPGAGHFLIAEPEWLKDNDERVSPVVTDVVLIPACDVEMVEFLKTPDEFVDSFKQLQEAKSKLCSLYPQEKSNGQQIPAAVTEQSAQSVQHREGHVGKANGVQTASASAATPEKNQLEEYQNNEPRAN